MILALDDTHAKPQTILVFVLTFFIRPDEKTVSKVSEERERCKHRGVPTQATEMQPSAVSKRKWGG
ncbi:hypothetical protein AT251_08470 [Enterovibrio nigricans]|nr:hypothetical protein AT251_08470 [Enterovibrio nigricans]